MKYIVKVSKWVAGSGFSYTTEIDNFDEKMTAAEYLAAVESNGAGYVPDDDGDLFFEVVEVLDEGRQQVIGEGAWGREDFED